MARRDPIPPYEIMRGGSASPSGGQPAASAEPETADSASPSAPTTSTASSSSSRSRDASPWWVGSTAPIVLRLPRGLAIGIALGLIGLLVLAYWAGHSQGYGDAVAGIRNQEGEAYRVARAAPDRGAGQGDEPSVSRVSVSQPTDANDADPRQPGLNYFVIARYPEDAARRLASFLRQRGVATVLVPIDNELFHVIAVDQGFRGSERGSPPYQAFKRELQQAGRAWQQHNGGGDDLSSMYDKLYQPAELELAAD